MIKFIAKLNTHPYEAEVWFTNSENLFKKKRAEFGDSREIDLSRSAGMTSYFKGGTLLVVGIFDNQWRTLVHELGHTVIHVLTAMNMPINPEHSEAFCYYLDGLFRQCEEILNSAYYHDSSQLSRK